MAEGGQSPLAIGMIVPSGGPEPDYYGYERAAEGRLRFYLTISRVGGEPGHDHDPEALKQTARFDWLVEAAERIADCRLASIEWACTSGSFVLGRRFAEEQVAAVRKAAGVPAGSTSLAFARACAAIGARKVAILATYPENVARLFVDFLAEFGIGTTVLRTLDVLSGWDAARLGECEIAGEAARLATTGADAVLIPDTALPTFHFVAKIESRLGMPVLSANAVTVWDALQLAGRPCTLPGYGSLLSGSG
jgi:maleate cis-trans isomerase